MRYAVGKGLKDRRCTWFIRLIPHLVPFGAGHSLLSSLGPVPSGRDGKGDDVNGMGKRWERDGRDQPFPVHISSLRLTLGSQCEGNWKRLTV